MGRTYQYMRILGIVVRLTRMLSEDNNLDFLEI